MKKAELQKRVTWLEKAVVVFYLIYYSAGIFPLFITQGATEGDNVDVTTFNWSYYNYGFILSYLFAAFFLVCYWKKAVFVLSKGNIFLYLLIAAIPASIVWSILPESTYSGSIGMIGTTLFGFYIAVRFSLKEQLQLLGCSFGIAIVLSFLFAGLLPKYGLEQGVHAGAFRGIYTHKNGLGKYMVLSLSVFLLLPKKSKMIWVGLGFSVLLILLCRSTNALVNATLMTSVFFYTKFVFRSRPNLFILATSVSILLAWFSSQVVDDVANLLFASVGKDASFSGRTDVWEFVIYNIKEKPFLGHGFNAFWRSPEVQIFAKRVLQWGAPDAHNGYLDLIVQVGLIGFVFYVLSLLSTFKKSFLLIRNQSGTEALLPFMVLVYITSINFMESTLLGQNSIAWLLFISLSFTVPVELYRSKVHRKVTQTAFLEAYAG